ncbi:ABC transporter ATP-binding protein [Glaciecola siphonariae]|uniref:ABC transporter ATP-binding protein n=1 Tax=Glaciecola siphonariae TaxID=521012 RepID=A0ABV9LR36_9ALTE
MLALHNISLFKRLSGVSLRVERGQWWTLLGPNGAGKSTLLSLAAGLMPCEQGFIELDGLPLQEIGLANLANRRCLVTQSYSVGFHVSVQEMLSFYSPHPHVPELVEQHLQIKALLLQSFDTLSGGERQRVHLARNLMQIWTSIEQGDALLLLDEPLQQMDVKYQVHALTLLFHIQQMGNALLMSHHDINQAYQFSSHAGLLKNTQMIAQGAARETITLARISALYDQAFHAIEDTVLSSLYFTPKA